MYLLNFIILFIAIMNVALGIYFFYFLEEKLYGIWHLIIAFMIAETGSKLFY